MEPVRESFVFHAEYVDDLPEEFRAEFAMMAVNYGIYGISPELSGLELALWVKIRRRIDHDCQEWETTRSSRSRAGSSHRGNQYSAPQTEQNGTERNKLEQNGTERNKMEQDGTNGTVSVSVPVSVNVTGDGDDDVRVRAEEPPPPPPACSMDKETNAEALKIYGKLLAAGLPCEGKTAKEFYMKDYRKALSKMGDIRPDELSTAVDNYIAELRNPDSYIERRYPLEDFVRTRTFMNCLPRNYSPGNFVRWDIQRTKERPDARTEERKRTLDGHPRKCGCGAELFDSSGGQGLSWYCKKCEREWVLRKGKWEEDA